MYGIATGRSEHKLCQALRFGARPRFTNYAGPILPLSSSVLSRKLRRMNLETEVIRETSTNGTGGPAHVSPVSCPVSRPQFRGPVVLRDQVMPSRYFLAPLAGYTNLALR